MASAGKERAGHEGAGWPRVPGSLPTWPHASPTDTGSCGGARHEAGCPLGKLLLHDPKRQPRRLCSSRGREVTPAGTRGPEPSSSALHAVLSAACSPCKAWDSSARPARRSAAPRESACSNLRLSHTTFHVHYKTLLASRSSVHCCIPGAARLLPSVPDPVLPACLQRPAPSTAPAPGPGHTATSTSSPAPCPAGRKLPRGEGNRPRRADRPGSLSGSPRLSSDQIKGKERPQPPAAAALCSQKGGRPPRDSRSRGTRGGGAAATDEVLPVPATLPARSRPWDDPRVTPAAAVTPLNSFSGRRPSSPLRLGLKINPNTSLLPRIFLPEALVTPPESFRSPRSPAAGRTLCPLHSAAGTRERPGSKQLLELLARTQHAAPRTHRARDPPTLPAEPPRCSKHPAAPRTILPARAAGRSQAEPLAVKAAARGEAVALQRRALTSFLHLSSQKTRSKHSCM